MAQVALLAAEGRDAEAAALLPTVRPMLATIIDRGSARWFTEELDTLEARITARQAAA